MAVQTTLTKNIVILGGSYGGVSTAHYVLKHVLTSLPTQKGYRVILISVSTAAMCRPACPRALISDSFFDQDKLFVDIDRVFKLYGEQSFQFIHGRVAKVDHQNRLVTVDTTNGSSSVTFHSLVIATGASTPSPLHGLNRDKIDLHNAWVDFRKGLTEAKSIIIAGAGPAGVETAGELGEYLNGRAAVFQSKLERPNVPITVITSAEKILPALRPSIASQAETYLAKVGVTVIKGTRIERTEPIDAGKENSLMSNTSIHLSDGRILTADLYIPATGTTPNTAFLDPSLLASDHRVETNAETFRVDHAGPRIYAIGDASTYARPSILTLLGAIPLLCANMKRDLLLDAGKSEEEVGNDRIFKEDTRETHLVPIGRKKGVGAVFGWQVPGVVVWGMKGRDYWMWTTGKLWDGRQWSKES